MERGETTNKTMCSKMKLTFRDKLLQLIDKIPTTKNFVRGDFLLKEGEIERNIYFVEKGAVRVFLMNDAGEQTIRLGYKGYFINSFSSFMTEKPSALCVDIIRKTTIKIIPKSYVEELANENLENLQQYATFLELMIVQQLEREIDLLTPSFSERLERVLRRSPDLFKEIPLKYIASYLRMTPETLSRIRKNQAV